MFCVLIMDMRALSLHQEKLESVKPAAEHIGAMTRNVGRAVFQHHPIQQHGRWDEHRASSWGVLRVSQGLVPAGGDIGLGFAKRRSSLQFKGPVLGSVTLLCSES